MARPVTMHGDPLLAVAASQSRDVPSVAEAVRRRSPSGPKQASMTAPRGRQRRDDDSPVVASQTRAVRSSLAVMIRVPSGVEAAWKITAPRVHEA